MDRRNVARQIVLPTQLFVAVRAPNLHLVVHDADVPLEVLLPEEPVLAAADVAAERAFALWGMGFPMLAQLAEGFERFAVGEVPAARVVADDWSAASI